MGAVLNIADPSISLFLTPCEYLVPEERLTNSMSDDDSVPLASGSQGDTVSVECCGEVKYPSFSSCERLSFSSSFLDWMRLDALARDEKVAQRVTLSSSFLGRADDFFLR